MSGPSRELYRSGLTAVGTFRCHPGDAEFPGGWMDRPTMVFPRTCVRITQEGADTVVADANTVVLYRGEQEYARHPVDEVGDRCEWFEVDPSWLREAAAPFDPDRCDPAVPPIGHTHGPASPAAYALQRSLTRALARTSGGGGGDPAADPLWVEEALLRLVDLVIPPSYGAAAEGPPLAAHRHLVDDAKTVIATRFAEPLSLETIGAAVGASRYHLARTFRRVTGWSVHGYLTSIRLRAALGHLEVGRWGIAETAVATGFASHSHFTQVFRSAFGLTPSAYRDSPRVDLGSVAPSVPAGG